VVAAGADHRRVGHRREPRVVVEERRGRPRLGQDLPGGRVDLLERDTGRGDGPRGGQDVGDHAPGGADRVDLPGRLDLDHWPPPSLVTGPGYEPARAAAHRARRTGPG